MRKRIFGFLCSCLLLMVVVIGFQTACKRSDQPVQTPEPAPNPYADELNQLKLSFDNDFKQYLSEVTEEMGVPVLNYQTVDADTDLMARRVTFTGTSYQLGYLIGRIARKSGYPMQYVETQSQRAFNRDIIAMYAAVDPRYIEKASGTAAAFERDVEDLDFTYLELDFYVFLWWDLFKYADFEKYGAITAGAGDSFTNACSIIAYYDPGSRQHMVGRNFDTPNRKPSFFFQSHIEGAYRSIGNTCYTLHHWVADGVNEKGLFMGIATNEDPPKYADYRQLSYPDIPAVQASHMTRIVLDTCADVPQALEKMKSLRVWFPYYMEHFLLADQSGRSVIVEFDKNYRMVVFDNPQPYEVLTNTAFQEGLDSVKARCERYNTVVDAMNADPVNNLAQLYQVTSSIQITSGPGRTLWTAMYDLNQKTIHNRYLGNNHRTVYTLSIPE